MLIPSAPPGAFLRDLSDMKFGMSRCASRPQTLRFPVFTDRPSNHLKDYRCDIPSSLECP
jgi:hypothetical protein